MPLEKLIKIYVKKGQIINVKNAPDDDYTIINLDDDETGYEEDVFDEVFTIVIKNNKIIDIYNLPDDYESQLYHVLS